MDMRCEVCLLSLLPPCLNCKPIWSLHWQYFEAIVNPEALTRDCRCLRNWELPGEMVTSVNYLVNERHYFWNCCFEAGGKLLERVSPVVMLLGVLEGVDLLGLSSCSYGDLCLCCRSLLLMIKFATKSLLDKWKYSWGSTSAKRRIIRAINNIQLQIEIHLRYTPTKHHYSIITRMKSNGSSSAVS